jgi:hypothetical protein
MYLSNLKVPYFFVLILCIHKSYFHGHNNEVGSMMHRKEDEYLTKHLNCLSLGGPIAVKNAVKITVPFEVNRCASTKMIKKTVLQNGSAETIKRVVDKEIAKIDNKSVHSNTYV